MRATNAAAVLGGGVVVRVGVAGPAGADEEGGATWVGSDDEGDAVGSADQEHPVSATSRALAATTVHPRRDIRRSSHAVRRRARAWIVTDESLGRALSVRYGLAMRPRHRARAGITLALATGLSLLLSACGGSPSAPVTVTVTAGAGGGAASPVPSMATAATVDGLKACTVLTKDIAQAIVNAKLKDGVEGSPTEPSCEYDTDPTGPKTAQVRLTVGDGAKQTYDTDKRIDHKFTAVPGLGDEAWQEDFAIFVRKGTTWYGLTVVLLDSPSVVVKPLQTGAAAILPKIP